jgi:hypothetical protein
MMTWTLTRVAHIKGSRSQAALINVRVVPIGLLNIKPTIAVSIALQLNGAP